MIGLRLPDIQVHSERVVTVLGQNPGPFTGPGTNTYLIGKGGRPVLLDTGVGAPAYEPLLQRALDSRGAGCRPGEIVLTHVHPDHIGGVPSVLGAFGPLGVKKRPWPEKDGSSFPLTAIDEGSIIEADGATLRAIHTPGHARDHLCFYLEEERALFTGDLVLGAGTTVITEEGGGLAEYLASLRRLLDLEMAIIYPAHGPPIRNPHEKVHAYIAHRELREQQIVAGLQAGVSAVSELVTRIYTDVPEFLHAAAASSVLSHLRKLEAEGALRADGDRWFLT
jgi:glyoxylase-like metal-dependent hydrolase (beta-lactamase superfamily II)